MRFALVSPPFLSFAVVLGCALSRSNDDRPPLEVDQRMDAFARILRAEDRRVVDGDLLEALRDESADVRAAAVRAIARIANPDALTHLTDRLTDPDAGVRSWAVFGLGLLKQTDSPPVLAGAYLDPDAEVRARAVQALGFLGDQLGGPVVLSALSDPAPEVREEAGLAAWRIPDPSVLLDRLIAGTADPEARVRFACAYALARLAAAPHVPPSAGPVPGRLGETDLSRTRAVLRSLGGAKEPEIRMQVARGLAHPATPDETATLGVLANDAHSGVRVNAARSLAFEGAPVVPHLVRLLRDPDAAVQRAAAESMAAVKTPDAARVLLEGLEHERRGWILEAAIASLVDVYPRLAPPHLASGSVHSDPRVRARVASLLEQFDGPESDAIVRRLLRDSVGPVRAAAVKVAAQSEPIDGPFWTATLEDDDPAVRAALATAVGSRWSATALEPNATTTLWPVLEAAWELAAEDDLPDARLAVVASAATDPDDPRARSLLTLALGSADPVIRRNAAEVWREAFGEDRSSEVGAVSDLPLEEYRRIVDWSSRPRAAVVTVQRPGFAPGRFVMRLLTDEAPLACWNFARLAESGFFSGLALHRVVPNFVAQDGDPRGDGLGGPGYAIRDEFGPRRYWAGTVGMATDGPDTAGSQWFVALSAQPHLDGRYSAFGMVVQNFEGVVARLVPGDRIVRVDVYEGDGSEPLPEVP